MQGFRGIIIRVMRVMSRAFGVREVFALRLSLRYNIRVGIITNSIPLWSLHKYTIRTPKSLFLILLMKAPTLNFATSLIRKPRKELESLAPLLLCLLRVWNLGLLID